MKGTICILHFANLKLTFKYQWVITPESNVVLGKRSCRRDTVCCRSDGDRQRKREMCHDEGSSVPELHLILEECLPGAHSNQT